MPLSTAISQPLVSDDDLFALVHQLKGLAPEGIDLLLGVHEVVLEPWNFLVVEKAESV